MSKYNYKRKIGDTEIEVGVDNIKELFLVQSIDEIRMGQCGSWEQTVYAFYEKLTTPVQQTEKEEKHSYDEEGNFVEGNNNE